MSPFYITTPIYYVNDRPHIGHCYTTLLADVAARFQRLVRGATQQPGPSTPDPGPRTPDASLSGGMGVPPVFFLTGTDEHADKVVTSAAEHGTTPQEWADRNAAEFKKAFEFIGSSHDDFIRTTEARHREKVAVYLGALLKSGDVYRGEYTGWYDEGQEEYVTENAAREAGFKSAISGRPLVKRTEPCYFFKLSKYQEELRGLIERDEFRVAPDSRKSEVLGRLRPPAVLNDVPISRPVTNDPATQWGIRIPGDPAHRVYVWIDALFNYLSTVDTSERRPLWPASVHLIGKDILWFHSVIWPALLLALSRSGGGGKEWEWVRLPGMVFGHGWWVSEGQKMSKSLGNFIDLERLRAYAARYGIDALRWYLVTQGPLSGGDADFSHAKFVEVYNADLANGIGNCASRVGNMIEKYFGGVLPDTGTSLTRHGGPHPGDFTVTSDGLDAGGVLGTRDPLSIALRARGTAGKPVDESEEVRGFDFAHSCQRAAESAGGEAANLNLAVAVNRARALVREVDDFISHTAPFTLAKQTDARSRAALACILEACVESLRIASLLLSPAMPTKMADLWRRWNCAPPPGVPLAELAKWGGAHSLKPGTRIEKGEALFMRADPAEPPPD